MPPTIQKHRRKVGVTIRLEHARTKLPKPAAASPAVGLARLLFIRIAALLVTNKAACGSTFSQAGIAGEVFGASFVVEYPLVKLILHGGQDIAIDDDGGSAIVIEGGDCQNIHVRCLNRDPR